MKDKLAGLPEFEINMTEHVDPRGLRKPELLKRVVSVERDNKRLRHWLKKIKELLDGETEKNKELKRKVKADREDHVAGFMRLEDDWRAMRDERNQLRDELSVSKRDLEEIHKLLEPRFFPEVKIQATKIEKLEAQLESFRSNLGALLMEEEEEL